MFVEVSDIFFSAGHFLVDEKKELCERLHGHNFVITARIYGSLNENSMVVDFRLLKQLLKKICSRYDHKVLLPQQSSFLRIEERNTKVIVWVHGEEYMFPREDVVKLPISNTTTEELSRIICNDVASKIKGKMKNIEAIRISIEELKGQKASNYRKL